VRRALATLAAFLVLAPAASAHVTVIPAAARPGETRTLTLRVLNERADANTVGVQVFIPAGTRFEAKPRARWTTATKPGEVDWTAETGESIGGETAKDFQLTVGPLPRTERLVLKVLQRYSDGEIVRWIQDPKDGAERPAPFVQLTRATEKSSSSAAGFAILAAVVVVAAGGVLLLLRRRRR
jgi:uncharacterized protein YcnI